MSQNVYAQLQKNKHFREIVAPQKTAEISSQLHLQNIRTSQNILLYALWN